MTTNTSPADPTRHALLPVDPSEFLAEARICLRSIPSDCLIVMAYGDDAQVPMMTTSRLSDLLATPGTERLEKHLELVLQRGGVRACAMIVLGDGQEALPEAAVEDLAVMVSAKILLTAAHLLPEPFLLESLWVVADARWRHVVRGAPDGETERILVSPPQPLRAFAETKAAAGEVFTGHRIPQQPREEPALAFIGRHAQLTRTDLASAMDPGLLFARVREALRRVRAAAPDAHDAGFVTDCELITELLSAVAVDRLQWELLAQCIDRGNAGPIDREQLLQLLVQDRSWSPDPDVCAGGSWYEAIEQLREVAVTACAETSAPERSIVREAWRGLTAMLVLLAWWNHRFATAGSLVDELWERDPGSTLAPLLARMTDTPIFPAWWPSP